MSAARTRVRIAEEPHLTQKEPERWQWYPCMPRPQKDKQTMGLVWVSPRFSKLSTTEKGKVVTTETEEEEEDLQALIVQIEA